MLTLRYLNNTIRQRELSPPRFEPWRNNSIAELAPEGAVACVVNDKLICMDQPEWRHIPPNESSLTYVSADGDITTAIALTILAIIGNVALFGGISATPSLSGVTDFRGETKQRSAAYGFDEIQNSTENGATIPVVYGEHDWGGQLIQAHRVSTAGKNHILHLLFALSEGPIEQIGIGDTVYTTDQDGLTGADIPTGLLINGVEASSFRNVTVSLRMGNLDQTAMPNFREVIMEHSQEFRLDEQDFEYTTVEPVNEVRVNLKFPNGLFKNNKKGEVESQRVSVRIRLYELDGTTLITGQTFTVEDNRRSVTLYKTLFMKNIPDSGSGMRRVIVRVRRMEPRPPQWKTNATFPKWDQMDIISVNEVIYAALKYPKLALMGLSIRANEQISGSTPRVVVGIKGKKVTTDNSADYRGAEADANKEYSNNPAWIWYDAATDPIYGLGNLIAKLNIDQDHLEAYAARNDALVDRWTGAATQEKRFVFNGGFDVGRAGWDALKQIGSMSRMFPVKVGNTIKAKLEKPWDGVANNIFSEGNVEKDSLEVTYINPRERANVVECSFRDETKKYELNHVEDEEPGLDEVNGTVRSKEVEQFGATNPTQVKRQAAFFRRAEQQHRKRMKVRVGIDAVTCEPGDVVPIVDSTMGWGKSGRIASLDGSDNVVMDGEPYAFESGRVYTYYEYNPANDAESTSDFIHTGTTNALPFNPLHGTSNAIGRIYVVGPKLSVRKYMFVERIGAINNGLFREVEGYQYVPEVFTDDSSDLSDDQFTRPVGLTPIAVTNFGVSEASTERNISRLTYSWQPRAQLTVNTYSALTGATITITIAGTTTVLTEGVDFTAATDNDTTATSIAAAIDALANVAASSAAAVVTITADFGFSIDALDGSNEVDLRFNWAAEYEFVFQLGEGAEEQIAGRVGANTYFAAFDFEQPHGAPIVMTIAPIAEDGIEGATSELTYVLTREDDGTALITIPGDPSNVSLANVSGNEYLLDWDAGANATSYEVRAGTWIDAPLLGNPTDTQKTLFASGVARYVHVRSKRAGYFSESEIKELLPAVTPAGYSTLVLSETIDFNADQVGATIDDNIVQLATAGEYQNCSVIPWYRDGLNQHALIHNDEEHEMVYRTKIWDLATSAVTHISFDVEVLTYFLFGPGFNTGLYTSMKHWSFFGELNANYLNWELFVNHSATGAPGSYTQTQIDTKFNAQSFTRNGRYFRLVFKSRSRSIKVNQDDQVAVKLAKALVQRLAVAFHRA